MENLDVDLKFNVSMYMLIDFLLHVAWIVDYYHFMLNLDVTLKLIETIIIFKHRMRLRGDFYTKTTNLYR